MPMGYPDSLQNLIDNLRLLPGVGEKTAERFAFSLLERPPEVVKGFADAVTNAKTNVRNCRICGNLTEGDNLCPVCLDKARNQRQILVVANAKDIIAIERINEYKGVYHVLGGVLSSRKGVMPDDLTIDALLERCANADEVILATPTDMDGDITSMYLQKAIPKQYPHILITRISRGLPSGTALDYADDMTISHALNDRRKIDDA